MRKTLLVLSVMLCTAASVMAQDEEPTTPVHTKSFLAVIEDAKFIAADEHYTTGQITLQSAIKTAEESIEGLTSDEDVRTATITLQSAIDEFIANNTPVNATEKVQNPSFDKDATNATTITGWVSTGFKENARTPGNASTSSTTISKFIEGWANATSLGGSGNIYQKIANLPAGHYRMTADVFVISQKTADLEEAYGAELYLNDKVVEIGLTDVLTGVRAVNFGIDTDIEKGDTLTIGFRYADLNVNWLGMDNITLYFMGSQEEYDNIVNAEKLAAAIEMLNGALTAARNELDRLDAPLFRPELTNAIATAEAALEETDPEIVTAAVNELNAVIKQFNNYNRSYANLTIAISDAEVLAASGELTEGLDAFNEAITNAKEAVADVLENNVEEGTAEDGADRLDAALEALQKAEASFRSKNASYSHPANVITNGDMSSTEGWDILFEGANPGLHINSTGSVTNFTAPFMECWVKNTDYGQENYARKVVTTLPDGLELPKGYYILKAAALATRQDQAGLEVSGVTLRLNDQSVDVHTANGVAQIYELATELNEDGGELSFGLYIDASTNANWIGWDEVELLFVGPKDKYMEDKAAAVLGERFTTLKDAIANAQAIIESVDPNGIDIASLELSTWLDEGLYILQNPTDESATAEYIDNILAKIEESIKEFYLSGVSPKDGKSFDFTNLLANPSFDVDAAQGWTASEGSELPAGTDCPYWWFGGSTTMELTQDFYQILSDMPAGNYLLKANASIRVDMNYATGNYTAEKLGNYMTSCKAYANNDSTDIHPFFYEDEEKGLTLESMMAMTNEYDYRHGNGSLIDYMLKESGYFEVGLPFTLEDKGDIKLGFHLELPGRSGQMPFIDYFKLEYFGNQEVPATGIEEIAPSQNKRSAAHGIYDLSGRRLNSTKLQKGLYIINGRRVVIR